MKTAAERWARVTKGRRAAVLGSLRRSVLAAYESSRAAMLVGDMPAAIGHENDGRAYRLAIELLGGEPANGRRKGR